MPKGEDNVEIYLEEPSLVGMNWMNVFHDRGKWRLYWTPKWISSFHKILAISWLSDNVLDFVKTMLHWIGQETRKITLCGQNVAFINVHVGDLCIYHCALQS